MADGLAKDGANDAVGRALHQLPGEAAADAVADEQELLDPEMIHQAELVIGERVPRVAGGNWAGGFTADWRCADPS